MSDVLVRGLQPMLYRKIQKMAEKENLSTNQMLLRFIRDAVDKGESEKEKKERQQEALRRIKEIREENFRQFGMSDDSAKMIREMRDSRNQ